MDILSVTTILKEKMIHIFLFVMSGSDISMSVAVSVSLLAEKSLSPDMSLVSAVFPGEIYYQCNV